MKRTDFCLGNKKILFLGMDGVNFSQQMLYDGFVCLFGRHKIIDFPENNSIITRRHHGEKPEKYHMFYEYYDEFWNDKDGGSRGWGVDDIVSMSKCGDFIAVIIGIGFLECEKNSILQIKYNKIINNIEKFAYMDGREHGESIPVFLKEFDHFDRPYFYLKREVFEDSPRQIGNGKVICVPFSAVPQHNFDPHHMNDYPQKKKWDMFFRGFLLNHHTRKIARSCVVELCEKYKIKWHDETQTNAHRLAFVPRKQMLEEM